MGQKTNPNSLRTNNLNNIGHNFWNNSNFNYATQSIKKVIQACCKNTTLHVDCICISLAHDFIFIDIKLLQIYNQTIIRHQDANKKHNELKHWSQALKRFYHCQKIILDFTGFKQIKLNIKRTIIHSRSLPIKIRQKTSFYFKRYNKTKFHFAHTGIKLLYLVIIQQAGTQSLTNFIRNNIRTRSRRKKHLDFLKFLKQSLESFKNDKTIKGVKIQIKGRFGYKPKGRSRIWKYQCGAIPLNTLRESISFSYEQAQTKLGAVGVKTWICKNQ